MGNVSLGTSGWSYTEWVGPVYGDEKESKLKRYCGLFNIAEINSTFYAYPSKSTVIGWSRNSPSGFTFAAKLPKLITHSLKLAGGEESEDALYKFCDLMEPLSAAGKLACILIQLPPSLRYDPSTLEGFLELLPKGIRFAIEFRHPSWLSDETWRLLSDHNVAYTAVDEPLLPPEFKITADFSYFRWHGRGRRPWYNYRYTVEELKLWIPRIQEAREKSQSVYGFFNNHYHGYAVENCLQVLKMLGKLTERQSAALDRVQRWVAKLPSKPKGPARMRRLSRLIELKPEDRLEGSLLRFTDDLRLERAKGIGEGDVKIEEVTDDGAILVVKQYRVVLDLKRRMIVHDCPDWVRQSKAKKFCKHVVRAFYSLQKDEAIRALSQISKSPDQWEFRASQ